MIGILLAVQSGIYFIMQHIVNIDKKAVENSMSKKKASSVSIIGGADGPTSIFLIGGKGSKRTLKQKIQKELFTLRKRHIAKSLKANPHTMEQVIEYAKNKWGYTTISRESEEYKMEYVQLRAAFILQYNPELLGKFKDCPQLEGRDEDSINHFMMLINQRQKAAEDIPTELFDIDLCIMETNKAEFVSKLILEKNYGYIGASASGESNKAMKKYHRAFRDIYQYYGVTQTDIDTQTKRYDELLRILATR